MRYISIDSYLFAEMMLGSISFGIIDGNNFSSFIPGQRASFGINQLGETASVAKFVLDQHVTVFGPGGIIPDDVRMLPQHGVRVYFVERCLFVGGAGDGSDAALDGVGAAVEAIDAFEDAAELTAAEFADFVELGLVSGDGAGGEIGIGARISTARREWLLLLLYGMAVIWI